MVDISKNTSISDTIISSSKLKLLFDEIEKSGSIDDLGKIIEQNRININATEIMSSLPTYINRIPIEERSIFKAYFWRQMSISGIRQSFCFITNEYVSDTLKNAVYNYITLLKKDYGIKQ